MTNSKDPNEYFKSGKAKFASGDYQGAIDDFNKAIKIDPRNPDIIWKRGIAQGRLGNHQAAQEDYMQANELKKEKEVIYQKAIQSIDDCSKALKNNPHDAEAFFKRALAKGVTGDSKGMLADVEKALEINPAFAKRIEVMQGMIDKNF